MNGDNAPTAGERRVIGDQPKPRVLLVGVELPPEVIVAVESLAPTVDQVENLNDVWQAGWDVLVTTEHPLSDPRREWSLEASPHLHVLAFVDPSQSDAIEKLPPTTVGSGGGAHPTVSISRSVRCTAFLEPARDDPECAELVLHHLIAPVRRRVDHDYWFFTRQYLSTWEPLAEDVEHHALAARYPRGDNGGEAIILPHYVTAKDRWVRWALQSWRRRDPERFGQLRDWTQDEEWMTAEEAAVVARRHEHQAERRKLLAELDETGDRLDVEMAVAEQAARGGNRRLLTSTGDDLVAAVAAALRHLGFAVEDVDEQPQRKGDRVEDLRVTDPDEPDWIALVEVKGYAGGARVTDFADIERFTLRFFEEHGRRPSRRWYIVNQHRRQPPSGRPEPLAANRIEADDFAAADGAVIDTRTLFQLVKTHSASDRDTLAAVRAALRARTEVWPLDDTAGTAP